MLIKCLTLPKRLKLAHKGVGVTQQIPSLVLICDAKTWSLENRNKTVSDTRLSLCTDRVLDFVQEIERLGSQTMKEKKLFRTLGCLHVLIRCLTLPKRLKLTLKGVGVTPKKSLP